MAACQYVCRDGGKTPAEKRERSLRQPSGGAFSLPAEEGAPARLPESLPDGEASGSEGLGHLPGPGVNDAGAEKAPARRTPVTLVTSKARVGSAMA